MQDVEIIQNSTYVEDMNEEIDYGEEYKLTIKHPSWHGYDVWYFTPNPINNFVIKDPHYIISADGEYRIVTVPEVEKKLEKYYSFYS